MLMWRVNAEASSGLKASLSIVVPLVKHDCHVRQVIACRGTHRPSLHGSLEISLLEANETIRNENGVIVLLPGWGSKTHSSC